MKSLPGARSRVYTGSVGHTVPASELPSDDLLINRSQFDSEGDWVFCRFTSDEIPALRMGFQAGSFNIGPLAQPPDPGRLQLHLEVLTRDGGLHWLPTGQYTAELVRSDVSNKDVRIEASGRQFLGIVGWPEMHWHAQSDDGQLEASLHLSLRSVTVLPDCLLPQAVFGMWETMGTASGWVRTGSRRIDVEGVAFYDHTRVIHRQHRVRPRVRYLYTTIAFDDGSGVFGYHAEDDRGEAIGYYCFGIRVGADGAGQFLSKARVTDLALDQDGLPGSWLLDWRGDGIAVTGEVSVAPLPLLRAWGSPSVPAERRDFVIAPLVLVAQARVSLNDSTTHLRGRGLAEYWDADTWRG